MKAPEPASKTFQPLAHVIRIRPASPPPTRRAIAANLASAHRALIRILAAMAIEQFTSETQNLESLEEVVRQVDLPRPFVSPKSLGRPKEGINGRRKLPRVPNVKETGR